MKKYRILKSFGAIGSFIFGYYVFGSLALYLLPEFISYSPLVGSKGISTAFGVLMGLVLAVYYCRNTFRGDYGDSDWDG